MCTCDRARARARACMCVRVCACVRVCVYFCAVVSLGNSSVTVWDITTYVVLNGFYFKKSRHLRHKQKQQKQQQQL